MDTAVLIIEGTAVVLATIFFFKYKHTAFKWLLPFLWIMLIMANAHRFFDIPDIWQFVRWNCYGMLQSLLFMWMFKSEMHSKKRKNIVTILMVLLSLVYIISILLKGPADLYTIARFTGSFLTILTIALYAADLFGSKNVHGIGKDIIVWIGATYLILFTSFPVIQIAKLQFYGREPLFTNILWIMTGIVGLMYAVLSFGFIYADPKSAN